MKFRFPGKRDEQIKSLFAKLKSEACLGFFAAADALNLGHVIGVPPYIYVPTLPRSEDSDWRVLRVASAMEPPDVILRQASTPKSIFRGAIHQDGVHVADVLQVWLDVANHPSRGTEQAALIYDKVILPLERNGK
ncbi:hypothetical protein GCM10010970_24540 [Silvimonas iriomotensis]|uniref:Uncharacterized protein n=3 Tax=Chitinibacteraceae TaxID=2897177 RepID=A0ABQ2PB55_9NEIS|nr:hypothetical protein GCM10010970_24540 [Silvimonas iriomotensis]GGP28119.1 hypothetical protein GCM10010971_39380 [Silvimonas amylolytica]